MNDTTTEILDCGHPPSPCSSITNGWGTDRETGERHCYECCAANDRESMRETGKATLYLVRRDDGWHITNWPGSLDFKAYGVSTGRHNIARTQRVAYFRFEGREWIARQYGEMTEIAHCRRLKSDAR